MITLQTDALKTGKRGVREKLDNVSALEAPIHIIPEIDNQVLEAGPLLRGVLQDHSVHLLKQIRAAVNITNGIDSNIVRHGCLRRISLFTG